MRFIARIDDGARARRRRRNAFPHLAALGTVGGASDDADITAWALSKSAEIDALGIADNAGRPLLIQDIQREGAIGSILARPVFKSNYAADATTNVVGIAGDWGSTAWGFVEGISISISDQATLNDGGTPLNQIGRASCRERV